MMMSSLALTCYSTDPQDGLVVRYTDAVAMDGQTDADLVCFHYQAWGECRYGFTAAAECASWKDNPEAYENIFCCNTSGCNTGCNAPKQAVYRAGSTIAPSPADTTGRK